MDVDLKRRRGPLGRRAQGAARSPTDQPCALSPPRAISAQARVRLNLAAEMEVRTDSVYLMIIRPKGKSAWICIPVKRR